jgi:hypothetical protein
MEGEMGSRTSEYTGKVVYESIPEGFGLSLDVFQSGRMTLLCFCFVQSVILEEFDLQLPQRSSTL